MTNLRQMREEGVYQHNPGKRFRIQRFIDNLKSGVEFAPCNVAKAADLTILSAARYLQQYDGIECVGRGKWRKL